MTRSQARENAFMLTFEKMFNPEAELSDMLSLAEECELFETNEFTSSLYSLAQENLGACDELIEKYSKGWKINRLPKVTLAILRLSLAEILFLDDTPDSVAANEAVELAKKYATAEDASFINGILGSVIRGKE